MIQAAVVGDEEAAFFAAKRGFVVLGMEEKLQEVVKKAGGIFILFGNGEADIKIVTDNPAEAAELMVKSADVVIVGNGGYCELVKEIAQVLSKPFVEGSGKEVVEKAVEKLVRYSLFGKK